MYSQNRFINGVKVTSTNDLIEFERFESWKVQRLQPDHHEQSQRLKEMLAKDLNYLFHLCEITPFSYHSFMRYIFEPSIKKLQLLTPEKRKKGFIKLARTTFFFTCVYEFPALNARKITNLLKESNKIEELNRLFINHFESEIDELNYFNN